MKTQGTYSKMLRRLLRDSDLSDPMKVEQFVFGLGCSNKTKNIFFDAYGHYCKTNEIEWVRPSLKSEAYPVKVPTEEKINLIISAATKWYAAIFQLSKHGLRPDEISKISLRDIDLEKGELSVRTSKLGLERTLRLKAETRDLLRECLKLRNISRMDEKLFPASKRIKDRWMIYRRRAYEKFKDPELLKIRLYDLRHWFGTTSYIHTRDIFHVKYLMGHRNILSTLHYMHVAKGLINYSDEYTVKAVNNLEEFTSLLESGFEYVSDYESKKILRKRK